MKFIKLNAAQWNVTDDLRRFRLVVGPPASGKTVLALFEAHKCAESGARAVFVSRSVAAMIYARQLYLELFPLHYHALHPRSTYYTREGGSVRFVTPEKRDETSGLDELLVADDLKFSWQEWCSQIDHWRLGLAPNVGRILIVGDKDEAGSARLALHHLIGWNNWGEFGLHEQFVQLPKKPGPKKQYVATVDAQVLPPHGHGNEYRESVVVGIYASRVRAQLEVEKYLGRSVNWSYAGHSAYSFDPVDFQRPNHWLKTVKVIYVQERAEGESWDEYQERVTREWEEANSSRYATGGYVPSGSASFVPGCDYNPLSGR
jgi:hypothetical protein